MTASIEDLLVSSGFYAVEQNLDSLYKRAADLNTAATNLSAEDRLEAFPSFISPASSIPQEGVSLTIDIGGTSSKAGIRTIRSNGRETWRVLFEIRNREMDRGALPGTPLEQFATYLSTGIASQLAEAGIEKSAVHSLGLVWSNAMKSSILPGVGVTGCVADKALYNKNEWFTSELGTDDDVGAVFYDYFKQSGFPIQRFLIANDTPLTLKASRGADAGVVASTGVNGTLLKSIGELPEAQGLGLDPAELVICNGEIGHKLTIPAELLTEADVIDNGKRADTAEFLLGGRFIPRLFAQYICTLSELGMEEFREVAEHLESIGEEKWREFRGADLSLLLLNPGGFRDRRTSPDLYPEELIPTLQFLCNALLVRGAKVASTVIFASIANLVDQQENISVSLDSRLAREIPIFWSTLQREFNQARPQGVNTSLHLVEPLYTQEGSISVPMRGAAAALDSLFV